MSFACVLIICISAINNLLKDDYYPIVLIEDIFGIAIKDAKIFTTLEIRGAYLNMPVSAETQEFRQIQLQQETIKSIGCCLVQK